MSLQKQALLLAAMLLACSVSTAKEIPTQLPGPSAKPAATEKPVKVYILAGQSNMVGIGQVNSGGTRWSGVTDAVVSVYPGPYSASADYDAMTPTATQELPVYGGVKPTPFPGGGVQVSRGFITLKDSGLYRFNAGYGSSEYNIMEIEGVEVCRREPGQKERSQIDYKIEGGKKYRFKVTFLTDAAGGLGWYRRTDIPGTLHTLARVQGKFPHLLDEEGNWVSRQDVWYKGVVTATANKWLSVGCGAGSSNIGPELQFGHIMGYYHDEPVLILKASQGNRGLAWDFLPPGSERYEVDGKIYAGYKDSPASWDKGTTPKAINWYAGKQYDDCFQAAHDVLANFDTNFPQWEGQGYEIAGFVWWQGHKDGSAVHASRYEQNLVRLIKSLRSEFKAPKAPFVVGTIGFEGWNMEGPHVDVAKAQLAVSGERGNYAEFAGNVLTVETRDFWASIEDSPRNQNFHYHQNAGVYMKVGDAMGRGMVRLLEGTEPVIDTHVHLWDLARPEGLGWIKPDNATLYRNFLPRDHAPIARANGVQAVVLVQAGQSLPDNQWNLDITAYDPDLYRGLVGNLSKVIGTDEFKPLFEQLCMDERYLGYRLSGRSGDSISDSLIRDLKATAKAGKSVDFLVGGYSLADVAEIAKRVPKLRMIVDHFGNVRLDDKPLDAEWVKQFRALGALPNVYCKVSALYGRVKPQPASQDLKFYRPILDLAFAIFGEDRLVFGSDWPVTRTTGDYASVLRLTRAYVDAKGPAVAKKVFSQNAIRFYRIPGFEK
jgi:predicted TIM-barrel fold metal-dependent hydrolase